MFWLAMAIIRFFWKRFRRCYTVSVMAYWWGDLVISVPLFMGSVMILGGSMWKKRECGGSAVLRLEAIQWSFWGVGSICARSPVLLFPLSMPLGQFLLGWWCLVVITCGGWRKNDRCMKKLAYISVVLGATFVVCS